MNQDFGIVIFQSIIDEFQRFKKGELFVGIVSQVEAFIIELRLKGHRKLGRTHENVTNASGLKLAPVLRSEEIGNENATIARYILQLRPSRPQFAMLHANKEDLNGKREKSGD